VSEEQRGQAYGMFGAFFNTGFLFGPALGGLFAAAGYTPAFVGSAIFRIAALLIVLAFVPRDGRVAHEARARARAVPRRALFSLALVGTYVLVFGDYIYLGYDITLVPLWLRHNLGAPVSVIGLYYAVWAVPNILGAPIGGRIADRSRRSTIILIFGLAQVPIYVMYGLATSVVVVIVIAVVHGMVYALMQPSVDATLADASPPDARTRAQSVYTAVGLASAFIAANGLGHLYSIDYRLPLFVMGAGFGLCILVGGTLVALSERRKLEREMAAA
jgi:MFS family permease